MYVYVCVYVCEQHVYEQCMCMCVYVCEQHVYEQCMCMCVCMCVYKLLFSPLAYTGAEERGCK